MTERLTGHSLLVALLANPARHSLSPKMHNAAYKLLNLDYAYMAFEVEQDNFPDAVQAIRALGIRGANVSMPYKEAIIPFLDEISPLAKLVGAVNTVVNKDGKGHLVGYNTDGRGAVQSLLEAGIPIKDQIITLTGAGGAGKAVAAQLAFDGAKEVRLFNRQSKTFQEAQSLVTALNEETAAKVSLTDLADQQAFQKALETSTIYIDATGLGMTVKGATSLIKDPKAIGADLTVMDLVYEPSETLLLAMAKEVGAKKTINGLGMLLYQGAEAFKLITGQDMPVAAVRELLFEHK
ncbi:shikimate dehydrogenase [Streptococcus ictaluri]|uniref:Shikimate dehydrogenase (NADP(+)) n=1 Tax=Streptococcus ictaluri 707-05 TaxID=764299 RepID=G5K163_9STRE|nr:shikimate dehydrogenase [Streptococcus ictaluri]EHI70367.1 shikimate dehydrogenase [Streptococcus ictaluri 707-05]